MNLEKAKEYLKETLEEIEENHKNGELILVQNPSTKELKEAIEVVLKEIDKKDKVIDELCNYIKAPYKINICKGRRTRHIAIKQYFYKKVEELG